ncbi:hypothetical protein BJ878DRAFT_476749 [Calycina marina]|uniref:Zn(2)-C6 fungal-type domain-containing protein n=1 Tax=Calycina marina TaxID=1763456 RepID=A0A9P8CI91_9HELO|nr:hypothetical protein BJ878DRAFT_476749 [Calycina marina]
MKSPSRYRPDISNISLGERRRNSDLARFSLDLDWAREVPDTAPSRVYPSPPMSGSPPIPPRHNADSGDRGHGLYGPVHDVYRGSQLSQSDPGRSQGPSIRTYQEPSLQPSSFPSYRPAETESQRQYQATNFPMTPGPLQAQLPQQPIHSYHPQSTAPFGTPERPPNRDTSEFSSSKVARKTKGHVASACVSCKRAHLRCDSQRPCSRCLNNGKEDACVDVQHKKRGRPRLRDDRETRFEGMSQGYPPPPNSISRPMSMYGQAETTVPLQGTLQRSQSNPYRVLKSQVGMSGPLRNAQFIERASIANANVYPSQSRDSPPQEQICAYLTMDMQIAKASVGFAEVVGAQSVMNRKLHDLVGAGNRDKIFRLQTAFENERREKEPNYLPPIVPRFGEEYALDRVIGAVGFGPGELGESGHPKHEMIMFPQPDGRLRTFQVTFALAKRESTYFIAMSVIVPPSPSFQQSPSAYSPYPKESQYFSPSPSMYQHNAGLSSYMQGSPYGDARVDISYRNPGPPGQAASAGNINMATFGQQYPRQEYPQTQTPTPIQYQPPRSEMPLLAPAPAHTPHQRDLQLAPIRDHGSLPMDPTRPRDDRGRVDIGGLLDNPDQSGRSHM